MTFSDAAALSTTVTFSAADTYTLRLTANDGALLASDDAVINVNASPSGPCAGNCGNLVSPRTLKVNGTIESCSGQSWATIPAKRNGGYCIQTTAGNYPWAYFTAW